MCNLTSKTGSIDKSSGNVHLEKDVVIKSEKGAQLTTDTLDWKRSEDTVSTEDPVEITDDALKVTAKVLLLRHPRFDMTAIVGDDVRRYVQPVHQRPQISVSIMAMSSNTFACDFQRIVRDLNRIFRRDCIFASFPIQRIGRQLRALFRFDDHIFFQMNVAAGFINRACFGCQITS